MEWFFCRSTPHAKGWALMPQIFYTWDLHLPTVVAIASKFGMVTRQIICGLTLPPPKFLKCILF